jgi:hypothetical protein
MAPGPAHNRAARRDCSLEREAAVMRYISTEHALDGAGLREGDDLFSRHSEIDRIATAKDSEGRRAQPRKRAQRTFMGHAVPPEGIHRPMKGSVTTGQGEEQDEYAPRDSNPEPAD